ncbi:hypothetical protein Rsub_02909 [Raphidocelis subcapitata]|uniref:Heme oxygenase n=1 Tax=Raphidocelis subcapitata TaxID=307507 RepID=A0A2V0NR05_9CHLO|nr:hypothetical protein Rsub_02909 [Raphidocelis subcapitata]|eukprot:GBF89739.1 hypothetical protein Rsub_02909 [Raphidocelis subcapitata]
MAPPPAAASDEFVPALRRATRRQHGIANALILAKLAVALTDRKLYGKALGQFLPVYAALEAALARHRAAPCLGRVAELALSIPPRSEAMARDLEALLGPDWAAAVPASRSARAYAEHLERLADTAPELLIPYAWSLNVPILLPFMGRQVAKGLGLAESGPGVEFFSIPGKAGRLPELRAAVNAAGRELAPAARAAALEEGCQQFRLNNAVVAEFLLPAGAAAAAVARALLSAVLRLRAVLAAALAALLVAVLLRRGGWA